MKKGILLMGICVFLLTKTYSQQRYAYLPEGKTTFKTSMDKIIIGYKSQKLPDILKNFITDTSLLNPHTQKKWNVFSLKKSHSNTDSLKMILAKLRSDTNAMYANTFLIYKDGTLQGLTDELIVKLKPSTVYDSLIRLFKQVGIKSIKKSTYIKREYTLSINLQLDKDALDVANILYETGLFEYCEPDFVRYGILSTNDPLYTSQWALQNTGQYSGTSGADIKAYLAWNVATGSGIKVAVIDEGVDLSQPDLTTNLVTGYDALGYGSAGAPSGDDAHGTACAGIIAAQANNYIGIAGVANTCQIIPIRAGSGGSILTTAAADAINWAVSTSGGNADIISCSWGGGSTSSTLESAISNATTNGRGGKGTILLFSSGNGNSSSISYPSSLSNVIAVGGTNMCDQRFVITPSTPSGDCNYDTRLGSVSISAGSNYGTGLGVVAPGINIATTDISGTAGFSNLTGSEGWIMYNNDYVYNFDGTSASCPFAAGVMALILSTNSNLNRAQATAILETTADKTGGYSYSSTLTNGTWDNEMGYGRINAFAAVEDAYLSTLTPSFCSSQTYSLASLPSGASVSWSASPSGIVSLSASGNSVTLTKITDGTVTLTGVITYNSGSNTSTVSTTISVGVITGVTIPILGVDDDANVCGGSTFNIYTDRAGSFTWSVIEGTIQSGQGTPEMYLQLNNDPGNTFYIGVAESNSCGLSDVLGTKVGNIIYCDGGGGNNGSSIKKPSISITTNLDIYPSSAYSIFPNPSKNILYVTVSSDSMNLSRAFIKLTDMYGKRLKTILTVSETNSINISNLAKGIYMIEINDGKKRVIKKVIKN